MNYSILIFDEEKDVEEIVSFIEYNIKIPIKNINFCVSKWPDLIYGSLNNEVENYFKEKNIDFIFEENSIIKSERLFSTDESLMDIIYYSYSLKFETTEENYLIFKLMFL